MRKIGLFGLTFKSGNKGCSALAYSFLEIMKKVIENDDEIIVFSYLQDEEIIGYKDMNIKINSFSLKGLKNIRKLEKELKKCNIIFDFTEGDSFSDIYGLKRAIKVSLTKELAIKNKIPLVLGPQTYGPYNNFIIKKWVKRIIKKSNYVCARDEASAKRVENLTNVKIDYYTDIAFALQPSNDEYDLGQKRKMGINISGLLMNGGYTGDNQFGLSVDYPNYIQQLVEKIIEENVYEIHLIPHVISATYESIENDFRACKILQEKYPQVIVAPSFDTPMEAKKYMSQMNVFTGARMHATIGAFSMSIPTIPFSYSPKFEGLFNSLNYDYVIHGKTMSTEEAVNKTMEYIHNIEEISEKQQISLKLIRDKLERFYNKIQKILEEV